MVHEQSMEVPSISPQDAWHIMQGDTDVILVDVRSDMEFLMIGHPTGAINIAWIDGPDWTINPGFVPEVRKLLLGRVGNRKRSLPVLLICRSGNRSANAAGALIESGLDNVKIVQGGFEGPLNEKRHRSSTEGWRHSGLPWEQC